MMTAHTANHDVLDSGIARAERVVARLLYQFVNFIMKSPFLIALILLLTLGSLYLILTYYPLVFVRRKSHTTLMDMLKEIDEIPDRDAMTLHADFADQANKISELIEKLNAVFLFRPIKAELSLMLADMREVEHALHKRVYGDEEPLTQDQVAELIEAFKPWKKDEGKHSSING